MPNPVVHWEVTGKNGKKLQDFYSKLFDWKVDANNPMKYGMVTPGGKKGINGAVGETKGKGRVTFFVEVADPEATLTMVKKLGGKTVLPVTKMGEMATIALFTDPEGNEIGLVKG